MQKAVRFILLALGIGAAGFLFSRNAGDLWESLRRIGWGFAWYMLASFVLYALDAVGWRLAFVPGQEPVSFARLFGARMAGEAVNKITPLAAMGGEPLKAYLLVRDRGRTADALASVAISKYIITVAQIAFIYIGIGLALPRLPGHRGTVLAFGVFPTLVLTAMVVTALLDIRFRRQRRKQDATEAKPSRMQAAFAFWERVAEFIWTNPRGFLLSFLAFLAGWGAGALELLAAAYGLGFPLSVGDALVLEALVVSINMATFFIPANVGSQEGGFAMLAPLLGISTPHGLALAVLRRCRDVIWIGYGLIYLAVVEGRVLFNPESGEPEAVPAAE